VIKSAIPLEPSSRFFPEIPTERISNQSISQNSSQITIPSAQNRQAIQAGTTNLHLNTALCFQEEKLEATMKEEGQTSCLHTPTWGVEGIQHSTSKEVENPLTTGSTDYRAFNRFIEDLNTPDNIDTINFEDLLTETDNTNMLDMIDFDFPLPEQPSASTATHVTEVPAFTTENIWTIETFEVDDTMPGLCLPAAEAEGAMVELPVQEEEAALQNNDLLKWIMDDSQIEDFSLPEEMEVTTPTFILEELKLEEVKEEVVERKSVKVERKDVKVERLTEEEKYRRMREQNNRASQACRAKRKRKLAEEEEELRRLEERNVTLRNQLEMMEVEVAGYKRKVLEEVARARQ